MTDPIFSAITAHAAAIAALDIAANDCDRNIDGLRSFEEQTTISNAAYRAKRFSIVASMTVAETLPTTESGRTALADHLQVARYRDEVANGHQINAYTALTGEKFVIDLV